MTSTWTRRDFIHRAVAAGAVVIGGPVALSACSGTSSGNTLDNARRSGSIKVGVAGEQPYGYTVNGRVTGEAPEVARVVFKDLGVNDLQATQVPFNSLIPALNAKQYDMVTAGMNITPPRCAQAAFSIPDYTAPTAFLVPKGNPQGITSFADVKNKNATVAVLSGAVEQGFATDAGVPAGKVVVFDAQDALLLAVTSKRADCASLTNISLNSLVAKNPGAGLEVTKGFFPTRNGKQVVTAGGFVFRKDSTDLLDAFNAELAKLHQSGQWLQIVRPFGFTADNLPPPDLTTQKLCTTG